MQKEIRTICYDDDLHLEAYRFEGIVQQFPNHFHNYYVIGFIEAGTRCLSCKNKEYTVSQGNILLFITTVVCNATAERLITEV